MLAARTLASVLVLAMTLLVAPGLATAQVADPAVSIALDTPRVDLAAANSTTLVATVTNGNPQVAGSVTFEGVAPDGWTVAIDPPAANVPAGGSADFTITLTAPEAGAGAQEDAVAFTATLTEATVAQRAATASATLPVTRIDPVIPPPPPAWYETPGGIAAIVVGTIAVVSAVAGFFVVRARRERLAREAADAARAAYLARETGITIQLAEAPRAFGPRRDVVMRVEIENVSDRPRIAVLEVALPQHWNGAPSVPRVPLSPSERATVSVAVRPDADVPAGTPIQVEVTVRPEEARELRERVVVEIDAPAIRLAPSAVAENAGLSLRGTANQRPPVAR